MTWLEHANGECNLEKNVQESASFSEKNILRLLIVIAWQPNVCEPESTGLEMRGNDFINAADQVSAQVKRRPFTEILHT